MMTTKERTELAPLIVNICRNLSVAFEAERQKLAYLVHDTSKPLEVRAAAGEAHALLVQARIRTADTLLAEWEAPQRASTGSSPVDALALEAQHYLNTGRGARFLQDAIDLVNAKGGAR